jgi:hypothetical protein
MQILETRGDKVYLGNLEYFILIESLNLQNKQYVSCRRLGNAIMGGSNIGKTNVLPDWQIHIQSKKQKDRQIDWYIVINT